jgi:hypothetical protein
MQATSHKSSTPEKIIDRRSLTDGNNPFISILKDLPGTVLTIDFDGKFITPTGRRKIFPVSIRRA